MTKPKPQPLNPGIVVAILWCIALIGIVALGHVNDKHDLPHMERVR